VSLSVPLDHMRRMKRFIFSVIFALLGTIIIGAAFASQVYARGYNAGYLPWILFLVFLLVFIIAYRSLNFLRESKAPLPRRSIPTLKCPYCGHVWRYAGHNVVHANCPDCHRSIRISRSLTDEIPHRDR
jgi:hypothetical protein